MQPQPKAQSRNSLRTAFSLYCVAFALGFSPIAFNVLVDPYQVVTNKDRTTAINDIAEKSHYPLWKLAKYEAGQPGSDQRDVEWHYFKDALAPFLQFADHGDAVIDVAVSRSCREGGSGCFGLTFRQNRRSLVQRQCIEAFGLRMQLFCFPYCHVIPSRILNIIPFKYHLSTILFYLP